MAKQLYEIIFLRTKKIGALEVKSPHAGFLECLKF